MIKLNKKNILKSSHYYIIPLVVALFNILIILVPNLVISSAKNGLLLWFNTIIPSILPFLIGTNLLIRLGFIDFLGNLLEPFMKKLFNISGSGAFALILGMFSGYPIGAKITCELREKNKISKYEAQRLISFTNNSGPLFIIGTVGIGMFQNIKIGYLMLLIHYISAISVGILFRFYKYNKSNSELFVSKPSLKKALKDLKTARIKENKSFGEILSESIQNSLETISIIGGFVIAFSVISSFLQFSNIFVYIGNIFLPENLRNLTNGLFMGLIEITNGANILGLINSKEAVILACGLISFSGFSIISQTLSILSKTDIKIGLYIIAKLLHGTISVIYCVILIPIIEKFLNTTSENVFNSYSESILKNSSQNFLISIVLLFTIAFLCSINYKIKLNKKL